MWTDKSYDAALQASNELLRRAHELNEALGAGGGATPPEAVLEAVGAIAEQVERLKAIGHPAGL